MAGFLYCVSIAALATLFGSVVTKNEAPYQLRTKREGLFKLLAGTKLAQALSQWSAWQTTMRWLQKYHAVAYPSGMLLAVLILIGLVGFVLTLSPLGVFILIGLYFGGISLLASRIRRLERLQLVRDIPDAFRTLATALSAGKTLRQAVEYIGTTMQGTLGEGFSHAALRLEAGASLQDALEGIEQEVDGPGMNLMVCALEIAQRTGSPLKDLFSDSARYVEKASELKRELSVKTAQVRLSARVVCTLPILIVALLALISPDFKAGLLTTQGLTCIALAALMDAIAILIIKRLAQSVM